MEQKILNFIKNKDYVFEKYLGRGACGKAVLLKDTEIDKQFVCKKYEPMDGIDANLYFKNFLQEIKLMYDSNHENIIRIYSYYTYPAMKTGYILMEYIEGENIAIYIKNNPEQINNVFEQLISGFKYLEEHKIIHRDIRDSNILITKDGIVKIIDFGFGKKIEFESDKYKSVSLNWWCETPNEFENEIYDEKTEIYFVGKLFEKIIKTNGIGNFLYIEELNKMIQKESEKRINSFSEIYTSIFKKIKLIDNFSDDEKEIYRNFADSLISSISKIEYNAKFYELPFVINKLEFVYQENMLEMYVQNVNEVISSFVDGQFYYKKKGYIYVALLKDFIDLLKRSDFEKQKILMLNINNRLKTLERYTEDYPEDIPF